jgi:hypothetical protein
MRNSIVIIIVALLCSSACVAKIPAGSVKPEHEPAREAQPVTFSAPDLLSQDALEAYNLEHNWIERLKASSNIGASYVEREE